ncbi:hypothetical protein QTH91_20230 [Variovorax dokdonensis]|uniref:Uncharacterized protein n=1 Tax=Variovorax dokdonensis TaxID=344883 RepID=A0ABT7NFV4_9BURK|nr:hypothetical protein [Variovorax dokdonensis]MDM0046831.1 hypothetical protein [Variovorax dokdonensis]
MHDAFSANPSDDANARKVFAEMEGTRKAMFELNLATYKQAYEVLTPDQRNKLARQ